MRLRQFAASAVVIVALCAALVVYGAHPSRGSDHQDSPAMVAHPAEDITDVFVFPSPANAAYVDLVMNVFPLIPAGRGQRLGLDPATLYQFKIAHTAGGPSDLAFQVLPTGTGPTQHVTAYIKSGPSLSGDTASTLGTSLGSFAFDKPAGTTIGDGVRAFAGLRADPFFFDLFQFFTILPDRLYSNPRTGDALGTATPTFNGFASGTMSSKNGYACSTAPSTNALTQVNGGFNVISIVLEIPRTLLATSAQSSVIHLWATTSVRTNFGTSIGGTRYQQMELLARPAVKELFETFADHATTNLVPPYADPTIANSIAYFMPNVAGRSAAISHAVSSVLYPNEMIADLSQPAPAAYLGVETGGFTGGKFGGRALTDDVIGTSLGVVFGNTIPNLGLAPDDGKENACLSAQNVTSGQGGVQTQAAFPYLAVPH